MKKKGFILIALLFASILFISCSESKKNDTDTEYVTDEENDETDEDVQDDPRFDQFIESLKKDLEKSKAYGVSVAVMENGKVTFKAAIGSKDSEGKEPLTTETLMQIGSTTKQMTATALLKKIQEGKAGIDDHLTEVIPDLEFKYGEDFGRAITLHHLLTHQGGFYDLTEWDEKSADDMLYYSSYGYANKYFIMNPPGIFWNYSNPNFSFAGLVTEELDTRFWPDIMREDIFLPLGMERTYLRKEEVASDGDYAQSYGYRIDDLESGKMGTVDIDMIADSAFTRPAGLVWTTPEQMMKWAQFIMEGNTEVLSDNLHAEITKPQVDTLYGDGIMQYGYGIFVESGYMSKDRNWYELPVWEHDGNTISFSSIFYIIPDLKFAVSIISSGFSTDFSDSLDTAITTLATLPEPSSNVPKYEINPDRFNDHTGAYHDQYNVGTMIITREEDKLLVSAPTLEQYGYTVSPELYAVSSDIFLLYLNGEPLDIVFIKSEGSEKSVYMRNRIFVLTRVESPEEIIVVPHQDSVRRWFLRSKIFPDRQLYNRMNIFH